MRSISEMHGVYFIVIHCLSCLFPECITKGSRFTFWGSAGLTRVRVTCFWCPQPSATVCNRPFGTVVGAKFPCLWEKSQKRDFFDVSEAVLMSFCVAGGTL